MSSIFQLSSTSQRARRKKVLSSIDISDSIPSRAMRLPFLPPALLQWRQSSDNRDYLNLGLFLSYPPGPQTLQLFSSLNSLILFAAFYPLIDIIVSSQFCLALLPLNSCWSNAGYERNPHFELVSSQSPRGILCHHITSI